MMIVFGIDILFFSIVGIFLIFGKGSWMISGYNSMSKEEKNNCNIEKISRAIGIFLLAIAVLTGVMFFVTQYAIKNDVKNIIGYVGGLLALAVVVGIIILIVIIQKYNNKK